MYSTSTEGEVEALILIRNRVSKNRNTALTPMDVPGLTSPDCWPRGKDVASLTLLINTALWINLVDISLKN
jgi:hypothetical protein